MSDRLPSLTPAGQIALWADRLRDLSASGLMFSRNPHDREAFQAVQDIALEMLALATGDPPESLEPLRAPIFGRPSPIVGGDAAIVDGAGRMLLVRRADNGCWAMPGGLLAVGETPAEGVVREALEETGVRCEPLALVGIYDSRLCGTVWRHQLYHLLFLCRPLGETRAPEPPSHGFEGLETAWFAEDGLPGDLDPGHVLRIGHAFRAWRGDGRVYFDRPGSPGPAGW